MVSSPEDADVRALGGKLQRAYSTVMSLQEIVPDSPTVGVYTTGAISTKCSFSTCSSTKMRIHHPPREGHGRHCCPCAACPAVQAGALWHHFPFPKQRLPCRRGSHCGPASQAEFNTQVNHHGTQAVGQKG